MSAVKIDPATITRGVTYLYRWWMQSELTIVPEAYVRSGTQATLVCPHWALVGSASPVGEAEVAALCDDLARPVFACCPELAGGIPGVDLISQVVHQLPHELELVVAILRERQMLLHQLGEENTDRDEWWRTIDSGVFKLWTARHRRLLLYPSAGEVYGFTMAASDNGGDFVFRSRSCQETGKVVKAGNYKRSEHVLSNGRRVSNLDLIFYNERVALLHLIPVGAGFKMVARRVPGFEGSL